MNELSASYQDAINRAVLYFISNVPSQQRYVTNFIDWLQAKYNMTVTSHPGQNPYQPRIWEIQDYDEEQLVMFKLTFG